MNAPPLSRKQRRTFLDMFDERECYVWFCWVPDGAWGVDLEQLDHESLGEPPTWWDWASEGLDKYSLGIPSGERSEHGARTLDWLLRQGLVPGQPFRCRVGPPQSFVSHTQDGDEYDEEHDVELVEVYPWPAERVVRAIFRFRKNAAQAAKAVDAVLEARSVALRSSRNLQVRFTTYFAPGQPSWDDMCCPIGLEARLESRLDGKHEHWVPIASGRSDKGEHREALSRLQIKVFGELPMLGDVDVQKLPSCFW